MPNDKPSIDDIFDDMPGTSQEEVQRFQNHQTELLKQVVDKLSGHILGDSPEIAADLAGRLRKWFRTNNAVEVEVYPQGEPYPKSLSIYRQEIVGDSNLGAYNVALAFDTEWDNPIQGVLIILSSVPKGGNLRGAQLPEWTKEHWDEWDRRKQNDSDHPFLPGYEFL